MPLRLVEVHAPPNAVARVELLCDGASAIDRWSSPSGDGGVVHRVLLEAEGVEELTDALTADQGDDPQLRIVVLSVEATLPRVEEAKSEPAEPGPAEEKSSGRVSREELLEAMSSAVDFGPVYLVTVVLSAVVAAVGLIRNDVAVIIGAMVIAPLLGPNVALALAATLGDLDLARKALYTNLVGVGVALGVSLLVGLAWTIDPTTPEILARTQVGLSDIVLALAAGAAGALAFTTGLPSAVIGVMVAVALLPPLVSTGLLAGAGFYREAWAATTLLATNVTCVNLAGVSTFLARRVSPLGWAAEERARVTVRVAISMWIIAFLILLGLIIFAW